MELLGLAGKRERPQSRRRLSQGEPENCSRIALCAGARSKGLRRGSAAACTEEALAHDRQGRELWEKKRKITVVSSSMPGHRVQDCAKKSRRVVLRPIPATAQPDAIREQPAVIEPICTEPSPCAVAERAPFLRSRTSTSYLWPSQSCLVSAVSVQQGEPWRGLPQRPKVHHDEANHGAARRGVARCFCAA